MSSEKKELTNEQLLTLKTLSNYKYSPEKKKILYLISQPDLKENKNKKELYLMNSDGSDTRLISAPGEPIAEPSFILKGEKIAYILKGELYFMNIDGTNKKKSFMRKKRNKCRCGRVYI
jgi:dipeptidyl aminopeptidase/acylaminoacyl peptidase